MSFTASQVCLLRGDRATYLRRRVHLFFSPPIEEPNSRRLRRVPVSIFASIEFEFGRLCLVLKMMPHPSNLPSSHQVSSPHPINWMPTSMLAKPLQHEDFNCLVRHPQLTAAVLSSSPTLYTIMNERHRTGRTLFLIPRGLRDVVDPGAILHYDQSIRILEPLDPGGAELEGRYADRSLLFSVVAAVVSLVLLRSRCCFHFPEMSSVVFVAFHVFHVSSSARTKDSTQRTSRLF